MSDVVVAALKDALAVVVLEDRLDAVVGLLLVLIETRLLKLVLPALDVAILVELEVLELALPTMELGLLVAGTVEMPEVLIATAVDDAVVELEEDDVTVQLPGDEIAEGRGCRTYP